MEMNPEERLAALLALYDDAKDAADHAASVAERLVAGIKTTAREVYGDVGDDGVLLESEHLRKPLTLTCRGSRRVVTATLRAKYPEVYDECSRHDVTWYLQRVK
jgi:hypothetical protein